MAESGNTVSVTLERLDERYSGFRIPRPQQEKAVGESLLRLGQLTPVVATERKDELALVDGFKRLHAGLKIGLDRLEVRVLPLSEQAAVGAVYSLNRHGCGMTEMEEAWVVRALCREHGLAQTEVGALLGRHKSWVSRRLMMMERLSGQVQSDVRVGLVSVTCAREIARLPRGNQSELAVAVHRHGLTSREASMLVTLFEKATDRVAQQTLLEDPREALEAHRGGPVMAFYDPRLSAEANRLRRLLLSVSKGAAQLSQALSTLDTSRFSPHEQSALRPLFRRVEGAVSPLCEGLSCLEAVDAS